MLYRVYELYQDPSYSVSPSVSRCKATTTPLLLHKVNLTHESNARQENTFQTVILSQYPGKLGQ
jgi:hypothetical protein